MAFQVDDVSVDEIGGHGRSVSPGGTSLVTARMLGARNTSHVSLDNITVSRPFDQTWARPPSTNSSIPVTKLESSDVRNNATFATSSGSPMRPIGIVETIRAITSAD